MSRVASSWCNWPLTVLQPLAFFGAELAAEIRAQLLDEHLGFFERRAVVVGALVLAELRLQAQQMGLELELAPRILAPQQLVVIVGVVEPVRRGSRCRPSP